MGIGHGPTPNDSSNKFRYFFWNNLYKESSKESIKDSAEAKPIADEMAKVSYDALNLHFLFQVKILGNTLRG